MSIRKIRMVLLSSVALMLLLAVLDISLRKVELLEVFGEQFMNELKTDAYQQAHQDVTSTAQRQLEINRRDIQVVSLSSIRGNINVKRSADQIIRLQYTVTASAVDEEAAQNKGNAVTIEEEIHEGQLILAAKTGGKSVDYNNLSIDYELQIPDTMKLKLENEEGAMRIHRIHGDVDASSDRGMMEIVDVKGQLSVISNFGSIYLSDITGNIELKNTGSNASIDHVVGAVGLNSQSGRNTMSNIDGKVTGEADGGFVLLREISGPVEVVSLASELQLEKIRGDTKITSEVGITTFMLAEDEGYRVNAAVSGGRILTQLPLPIKEDTDGDYKAQMNGVVGNGAWSLDVKTESGDIIFHIK